MLACQFLIDLRTKKKLMNTKNFEKEHKSRRIINFVTNSTFTDVVQLNEYSKRLRINLYSLKLRKKVAQSYPF
jgi:hypothetical protein